MTQQLDLFATAHRPPLPSSATAPTPLTSTAIPEGVLSILQHRTHIIRHSDGWHVETELMDGKLYLKFKEVMNRLRGHWNGHTHLFQYDPTHRLSHCVEAGRMPKSNPYAKYLTPSDIAELMVDWSGLSSDVPAAVLEPSAGEGALVRAILSQNPNVKLSAWEIDPFNRDILTAQFPSIDLRGSDWLGMPCTSSFDYVFMNPPFHSDEYVKHINRAIGCLKTNGVLMAIVPDSFLWHQSRAVQDLRNYVAFRGSWDDIGSPFAATDCNCLLIKMRQMTREELKTYMSPTDNGYKSMAECAWDIVFSCQVEWHDLARDISVMPPSEQRAAAETGLDRLAAKAYKKHLGSSPWTAEIKDQCVSTLIERTEDF